MSQELPPCGLYATLAPIGNIPAGRLVYFHNHGEPGPGLYLPNGWKLNRAKWEPRGHLLGDLANAQHLAPLPHEGFYRVASAFHCCAEKCRLFQPDELVQLGYDGGATPILFTPELSDEGMRIPDRGIRIEHTVLDRLAPLAVPVRRPAGAAGGAEDPFLH